MVLRFSTNIPTEEGQLYQCILQNESSAILILNKAKPSPTLTGLNFKFQSLLEHYIYLLEHIQYRSSIFHFYLNFQEFIIDINSILDVFACIINAEYQVGFNSKRIEFTNKNFMKKLQEQTPEIFNIVDSNEFKYFYILLKIFRDNYIHRGSPDSMSKESWNPQTKIRKHMYFIRLFDQEAASYRELYTNPTYANIRWNALDYDIGTQISIHLGKLITSFYDNLLKFSNTFCTLVINRSGINPAEMNTLTDLGNFAMQIGEVGNIFLQMQSIAKLEEIDLSDI